MNKNTSELHQLSHIIEKGLRAPLTNISEKLLNFSPADDKMSIGQLAIHCAGWAEYFLTEEKWEVVKWTCVEVEYPLTKELVETYIEKGFNAIRNTLENISDKELEVRKDGKKGYGYIIYRLLIHAMVHANQMAYIRQIKDQEWKFGSHFGDMASAIIAMKYSTSKDVNAKGLN